MAWYYGEFSCGHEGRVNIGGPVVDRERKSDWEFSRMCKECRIESRATKLEQENQESMEAAELMELPLLEGTDKQVAWATTLRHQLIGKYSEVIAKIEKFKKENPEKYKLSEERSEVKPKEFQRIFDYILEVKTDASYWIDNRFEAVGKLVLAEKENAPITDEELESIEMKKELMEEIKAESIVIPEEKVSESIAEIVVKDDKVATVYERNEDFIGLMKSLGYEWRGVWEKDIDETTGTAKERAAELGNKLLNAGFPVMIIDKETRENAVNGRFEPECYRWILKRDEKTFAINWKKYSDELYDKARSLPGSKWSSPSVVVSVNHHVEIEEFAEFNGFKFTKSARKMIEDHQRLLANIDPVIPVKVNDIEVKDGLGAILESGDEILDDLKD